LWKGLRKEENEKAESEPVESLMLTPMFSIKKRMVAIEVRPSTIEQFARLQIDSWIAMVDFQLLELVMIVK
jgi:hypothetical protein